MKRLRIRRYLLIAAVVLLAVLIIRSTKWLLRMEPIKRLHFSINTTWDSQPVDHDAIQLNLYSSEDGLVVEVDAPFFNDPPNPGGTPGLPYQGLWDYEVVEAFFLNEQNNYVEVEFCPHGQHLVLLLSGYRKPFKDMLNLAYNAVISDKKWQGKATIPWEYIPQNISKFNAYAIHGSGQKRVYEALFPIPNGEYTSPDFHRLSYFQRVNFKAIIPESILAGHVSEFWKSST